MTSPLTTDEAKACFDLARNSKDAVSYVNNKLTFKSKVSNSGFGCIIDRPDGYIDKNKQKVSGWTPDGDCNDDSGEYISNEPTHIFHETREGGNKGRLRNGKNCMVYEQNVMDNPYGLVSATGKLDFTDEWEYEDKMLCSTSSIPSKCLKVNDDNTLSVDSRTNGDMSFIWAKEGNEFRNIKSNKCLSINDKKVVDCKGPTRHNRWTYENRLLKNNRTGRCLDSNGNSVYMGPCDANNGYQLWDIISNGSKIKHSSGKCIFQREKDGKTELYLDACGCDDKITPGEPSERDYNNYINSISSKCVNADNWGYDKISNDCLELTQHSTQLMDKFLEWCDKNQSNESVNKYCMEFMKYSDLIQYYSRSCGGESALTKPTCVKIARASDQLILDPTAREFIKIKWDDAMAAGCAKNTIFTKSDKDAGKFLWKYTTNEADEECLSKWTFRDDTNSASPVDTLIEKTTSLGDTGYWCPKVSNTNLDGVIVEDPRVRCAGHIQSLIFLANNSEYDKANKLWKSLGGYSDIPIRIYKKLALDYGSDETNWSNYIKSNYQISDKTKDKIHMANFILFYGGTPMKVENNVPMNIRHYSGDGKSYIYKVSDYIRKTISTAKGTHEQTPTISFKANIDSQIYNFSPGSNYYVFIRRINDGYKVSGVDSSGKVSNLSTTKSSSFFNKMSIENNKEMNILIFIIVLIAVVIVSYIIKLKTKGKKDYKIIKQKEIYK